MKKNYNRREFLKTATVAGMGLGLGLPATAAVSKEVAVQKGKRVGIIGLDTSHSTAFTKSLNKPDAGPEFNGYRVVAAYPKGSNDIESSTKRVPEYTEEVKKYNVKIVDSIKKLLSEVDVVLLETNDGRPHLEQVLPVLKAGKRVFIDKPIAGSLKDAVAIFEASKQYKVPVFSSSSLRYLASAQEVVQGKIGKVLGADTYSPATLEKTHPDLFWYGIHGVETLFTVMGAGCKSVVRHSTDSTDLVVGTWQDNRIGTFRGTRTGTHDYGGTVFGEKGNVTLGPYAGYDSLLVQIIKFFETGQPPVAPEETMEVYAFMEAADESKGQGGKPVTLESVLQTARAAKG
ncbi:Gfo/Idh/MocA family oxidoreductase [Adhaeribacter swui]|uniref:Gfo/Idh/MocA family oxidoreductase n=1 Tax=Adhaeribacter swui TaxID=2086471 RepID=A0A7G7G2Y4_9BACT|nr:Gfo/Idh/MocA family oxidoreductase [Adhaeribacter swui]QNF31518.1 Gfo/Idh/MocA family oxidoreductase [Adhaeribacter swui]